jgi:hypothetical protein
MVIDPDDPSDYESTGLELYLARCTACKQPSLLGRTFGFFANPAPGPVPDVFWPSRWQDLSEVIPEPLRREIHQARRLFDHAFYEPSVVSVRKATEAFCLEFGVRERTLAGSLRKLTDIGHIDAMLLEWAEMLKVVGNAGAHPNVHQTPVSAQDARDALDLAEALFDHVYVVTKRFKEFRERRAGGSTPS